MKVYLFIIAWIVIVGFISKGSEINELFDGHEEKRTNHAYALIIISVLILFTGLRSSVGDTYNYIKSFNGLNVHETSILKIFREYDGYYLFRSYEYLVKKFVSDDSQVFLFGMALMTGVGLMTGFRRISCNYSFSLLLFMLAGKFTWLMNGIKQGLAVAIVFMAIKHITAEEKKYKYFIYLFIAYLVHPSAIIMLPAYFFVKSKPWSMRMVVAILLSLLAVTFVGEFTDLLNFMTEDTVFEQNAAILENDDGSNIMRFFVAAVPAVLAFLKKDEVEAMNLPTVNVMINMSVITACLYLISTFTSGVLMGRLPIYFELTGYALIPWLLENVYDKNDAKIFKIACIGCYIVFFYFQVWGLEYTSDTLGIYLY